MLNIDKKTVFTVSGNIGSRKTLETTNYIDKLFDARMGVPLPVTIATPTNQLSKQWQASLDTRHFPSMVISQDEGYRSSGEKFAEMCKDNFQGALCVNNLIALNADKDETGRRLLIGDEVWSPLDNIKVRFRNPDDVKKLHYRKTEVEGYYELAASVFTSDMIADVQRSDELDFNSYGKAARELGQLTENPHYRAIIDKKSFEEAASGAAFIDDEGEPKKFVFLQFTIFMKASILDDQDEVIILSAEFEKTLLGMMWAKEVNFVQHEWITSRLDNDYIKRKAPLVELRHVPVPNLSKRFFEKLGNGNRDAGNQAFNDQLSDCIDRTHPGKKYIFCTNKPDRLEQYAWKAECVGKDEKGECSCDGCGTRVIVNPYGWNHLRHYNMAVFAAGINFDPETERRLKAFYGIERHQAKEALAHQMVLQFLGRTSLRDPDSNSPLVLIAPDEASAAYIRRILGCAASKPLDMKFGEPPKIGRPKTDHRTPAQKRADETERKRKQRATAKAAALEIRA
jgi:hypothetical protein